MISRSDGKTFHLLLADYPARYPAERSSGETEKMSVCFWCSHILDAGSACSTVVILRDPGHNYAVLLANRLANRYRPPPLCELVNDGLQTMAY